MNRTDMKWLTLPLLALMLAACSSAPKKSSPQSGKINVPAQATTPATAAGAGCTHKYSPAQEDLSKRGDYKAGGLYAPQVADTTPDHVPDVDCIAEPVVTNEPPSRVGNRSPYSVLGKKYEVMSRVDGYVEQGTASYYGNKFHGRRTSNQEVYDMYAFTAAHKTLPLPSFARVTNVDSGKSVVVRVNDRGPFHDGRVIDLSYAAAVKLGITQRGTGRVEVRALTSAEQGSILAAPTAAPVKTTVATGLPTRMATGKPTGLDELVGTLPQSAAQLPPPAPAVTPAVAVVVAAADPDQPWRYHVTPQLDHKPTADEFDAWMKSRGVHVATGKPVASAKPVAASTSVTTAVAPRPLVAMVAPAPLRAAAPIRQASAGDVQLQVGSFASRENADRALARLSAAGIARASLSDVASNGRTLWRLRVQAPDPQAASELAGRIAGLGFGRPQQVRE
ncbi:MAG: septal ring lytic transglycosylase RlpA family protein [Pseudoxanthomonas sp.]